MALKLPTPLPAIPSLWSHNLSAPPRGLCLAREKGWLLAWDEKHWLYLLNQAGKLQGQRQFPTGISAACCADDGSALAAIGHQGEVWWLAPDLSTRWEQRLPARTVTAAIDSFGQYLAVSDVQGGLHLLDRLGRVFGTVQSPRPFQHLAFVPTKCYIVGSADFGLVAGLDFKGRWAWRDGLVVHVGALAVSGDGEQVALACFSEGLHRYAMTGQKLEPIRTREPCRLVSLTFDGSRMLVSGLSNQFLLLDGSGQVLRQFPLDAPPAALAIGALGQAAFVALPEGRIVALDLSLSSAR